MIRTLLFLFLSFFSLVSTAQSFWVELDVTHNSSGKCDGEINATPHNAASPVSFKWYYSSSMTGNTNRISVNEDISGLCEGIYLLRAIDGNGVRSNVFLPLGPSSDNPGLKVDTLDYSFTSGPSACDASISISATGGTGPYKYDLKSANFNLVDSTPSANSLCNLPDTNRYDYFYEINSSDAYIMYELIVDSAKTGELSSFSVSILPKAVSDSSVCDGGAEATTYGGTPPFTYNYNSGKTGAVVDSLCMGPHAVDVKDATGDSIREVFVVPDSASLYTHSPRPADTIEVDTVFTSALRNCNFDFSLPIDSFQIDTVIPIDTVTYNVHWTIYQKNYAYQLDANYHVDSLEEKTFALSVYCTNSKLKKKGGEGHFTVLATPRELQTTHMPIHHMDKWRISLFPNPVSNNLHIRLDDPVQRGPVSVDIFSISGRPIYSGKLQPGEQEQTIDTETIPQGVYLIRFRSHQKTVTKRFVK